MNIYDYIIRQADLSALKATGQVRMKQRRGWWMWECVCVCVCGLFYTRWSGKASLMEWCLVRNLKNMSNGHWEVRSRKGRANIEEFSLRGNGAQFSEKRDWWWRIIRMSGGYRALDHLNPSSWFIGIWIFPLKWGAIGGFWIMEWHDLTYILERLLCLHTVGEQN